MPGLTAMKEMSPGSLAPGPVRLIAVLSTHTGTAQKQFAKLTPEYVCLHVCVCSVFCFLSVSSKLQHYPGWGQSHS